MAQLLVRDVIGHRDAADLMQSLGVRKERGGMGIVAHAQLDQVEDGHFRSFQPIVRADRRLVARRGLFRIQLTLDADDVVRMQGHLVQQQIAGSAIVAVGAVGGTQRSSTQKTQSRSQGIASRYGWCGSASSENTGLGLPPPEMAMRAMPRAVTAAWMPRTKYPPRRGKAHPAGRRRDIRREFSSA